MVHGGSSGIGTTAIQLASVFGARVFATAGSDTKCTTCINLRTKRAINYRQKNFVDILHTENDANLILDMVNKDYIPRNIKALANKRQLIQIAFLNDPKIKLNFAQIIIQHLTMTESTLHPQNNVTKTQITQKLLHKI